MKKTLIALAMVAFATIACEKNADAADTYKRGVDSTFTAGCTDPTERTDGTALSASEIASVEYYIDDVDGNGLTYEQIQANVPTFTRVMANGCASTRDFSVDLQQFPVMKTQYRFAVAKDTDNQYSVGSVSNEFIIQSANPNAPGQIK